MTEGKAEGITAGDGSGKSTTGPDTKSIKATIGGKEFIIQDTVGYNDNKMTLTNQEIRDWVRASLIESGQDSVKFILT